MNKKKTSISLLRLCAGLFMGAILIIIGFAIWIIFAWSIYVCLDPKLAYIVISVLVILLHFIAWQMSKSAKSTTGAAAIGGPIIAIILIFPTMLIWAGCLGIFRAFDVIKRYKIFVFRE